MRGITNGADSLNYMFNEIIKQAPKNIDLYEQQKVLLISYELLMRLRWLKIVTKTEGESFFRLRGVKVETIRRSIYFGPYHFRFLKKVYRLKKNYLKK